MTPDLYAAYGLSIACDFALPELAVREDACQSGPDVEVRLGGVLEPGSFASAEEDGRVTRAESCLAWPGVGRFEVRAGCLVRIEPERGASEYALRSTLLGAVLATVLFQRGFLALHASAVALRDAEGQWGAVAFLGESGEGKSTMAAALHARGCPIVADDIIAIPPLPGPAEPAEEDAPRPLIFPGFAHLNLWPQSLAALGEAAPTGGSRRHKHSHRLGRGFKPDALPLRRLYLLKSLGAGEGARALALPPALRVVELARHCHRAGLMPPSEQAALFQACGALARAVPVRALQRPRDLARLAEAVRAVEEDLNDES